VLTLNSGKNVPLNLSEYNPLGENSRYSFGEQWHKDNFLLSAI
jgi:hypothetical protein